FGRPDKEVVVAGAEDAADQCHGNNQVQPFLYHFTVNTGGFDQYKGQDRTHNQLPHAFHPQVHNPPPEVFIQRQGRRVVEGEQPEHGQANQAGDQHHVNDGFTTAQNGHQNVENKTHHHYGNAHFGNSGLFQEFPAHGRQNVVISDFRQRGVRHGQVTDNG